MAMTLINEAIDKYGNRGSGDERVLTVQYEALMEFGEAYLFDLYHRVSPFLHNNLCLLCYHGCLQQYT